MKLRARDIRSLIKEEIGRLPRSGKALVKFKETREGGDVIDGEENDEYPTYEDTYVDVKFLGVWLDSQVQGVNVEEVAVAEAIPRNAKVAYLVVTRAVEWDTFSTTHGAWNGYNCWLYGDKDRANERAKEITREGSSYDERGEVHIVPIRG